MVQLGRNLAWAVAILFAGISLAPTVTAESENWWEHHYQVIGEVVGMFGLRGPDGTVLAGDEGIVTFTLTVDHSRPCGEEPVLHRQVIFSGLVEGYGVSEQAVWDYLGLPFLGIYDVSIPSFEDPNGRVTGDVSFSLDGAILDVGGREELTFGYDGLGRGTYNGTWANGACDEGLPNVDIWDILKSARD